MEYDKCLREIYELAPGVVGGYPSYAHDTLQMFDVNKRSFIGRKGFWNDFRKYRETVKAEHRFIINTENSLGQNYDANDDDEEIDRGRNIHYEGVGNQGLRDEESNSFDHLDRLEIFDCFHIRDAVCGIIVGRAERIFIMYHIWSNTTLFISSLNNHQYLGQIGDNLAFGCFSENLKKGGFSAIYYMNPEDHIDF